MNKCPNSHRILVLGLGNDILTDDGIGLQVVRKLKAQGFGASLVEFAETTEMGLALLDFITDYRTVILVDSIQTGCVPPGHIYDLDAAGFARYSGRSPHFLGVGETVELGLRLGLPMPATVRVVAVETEDPFTLGTELTPPLRAALPRAVDYVRSMIVELVRVRSLSPATTPEGIPTLGPC